MNATAAALLGLLEECGPMTGADLARVAQQRIGEYWTMTRSQVYRELTGLAQAGHVTAGERGARDATPYTLTPQGRQTFKRWLAQEQPPETVRNGLLLLVAFGRHLPKGRLAQLLDEHEARHRETLAEYRRLDAHLQEQGVDAHVRATLSFGLHYEEAVLRWFDSLLPEVRGKRASGARSSRS